MRPVLLGLGLAAVTFIGFPLCQAFGLDASLGWVANGAMPTPEGLLGTAVCVVCRAAQVVVAPVALGTTVLWLALAPLLGRRP